MNLHGCLLGLAWPEVAYAVPGRGCFFAKVLLKVTFIMILGM